MSGRGRGRVGGGGRGGQQSSSAGRGGAGGRGGRGRGGGRRESSVYNAPSRESDFPSLSSSAPLVSALSREVERRLNIQRSASTSATPQPSSSSAQPEVQSAVQQSSASASASTSATPQPSSSAQPEVQSAVQQSSASASASTSATPQPSSSAQPEVQSAVEQPVPPELPPASSKAIRFPARPGFGTVGRKCTVRANHFLVEVAAKDIHHYDVSITPEVASKKVCRNIVSQLVSSYQSHLGKRMLAYDGRKTAYAAGPLPFNSKEFVIKLPAEGGRREKEFKVTIKFATMVDIYHLQQFLSRKQVDCPQETIQALDVVLRQSPSLNYEVVGRSFFSPSLGISKPGQGFEYWQGFFQSLRPTQMGLSLNIDISARAFYEPILVTEFITKFLNIRDLTRPLSDQDRVKVKKALRGLKVEMSHGEYVKCCKVSGISNEPLKELSFPLDGTGTHVSVVQYFHEKYNIVLRHTLLPAIKSGSDAKPVFLPMEICRIAEGQRYTKRLNDSQVRALLMATCQRPDMREKNIKEIVGYNSYNADPLVSKEFGIRMRPELASVDARVLPPPMLKYHETGKESLVNPRVGQWNMIDKKMVNGGKVDYWTCISFSRMGIGMVEKFCEGLVNMCRSKGMGFESPFLPIRTAHPGQIESGLVNVHKQSIARFNSLRLPGKQLQLLIVILPDATGSYGTIKRVCETELGIVSQCCKPEQASKINKQYLENVALKINVKVGGRNTVLEQAVQKNIPFLTDVPTIVFGADVTHPQPGEDASPSIAAVVASMDWPEVTKYRGLVSAQCHREEIILDLYKKSEDPQKGIVHGGMIRELLLAFYRSTSQKPHRIIFYRDGVSEGQFKDVLLHEMVAIRQACGSLQENYLPRVTFVVVQKRHHTRLFPANHRDRNLTDRSGNILPGTVVDTNICHPMEFDFFLCSHAGIKGTSRPTHYHVLLDENRFTADALQTLTNNLCYTYARCTRSVSIVPPAYYAHLAAFRARYYIESEMSDSGSTSTGRASRERSADVRPLPTIKDNVKDVMFYC